MLGNTISHYHILEKLGEGGMGEVYRARDSTLNRDVALKMLPEKFAKDVERMARFQREAHMLASLNHPNIAAIHGLEESEGVRALVMELVEGPTLAGRIATGPIPLDEAFPIARQMAEALEYAHEKGIIHRDLKPANVKLTAEGMVKVLDFGLAKALEGGTTSSDPENSPTLTLAATQAGVVLGTAAYMAPEQARGKAVDRRADIWSFGVVFYEMLTGKRLFGGETVSDTLAAVLKMEPDWDGLPVEVPAMIRRLLRRCLTKDRQKRLQAIGDARIEIEEYLAEPAGASETAVLSFPAGVQRGSLRRERLTWATILAVLLLATITSTVAYFKLAPAPERTIMAEILPPENSRFNFGTGGGLPALSRDGRTLAFSVTDANEKRILWVRSLDSSGARPLSGTEGAASPFWSADSRALGFFADGKLKTIGASGGPVVVLADAPADLEASWNRDGTILFVPDYRKGLYSVAASGGAQVAVIKEDSSKYFGYGWPRFLPDRKHFLYAIGSADPTLSGTYFASLDGKENRLLLKVDGNVTYGSGFLLYLRNSVLMAQTFDPERGELRGEPHPVAERVLESLGAGGLFDASENGVLIYQQAVGRVGQRRLRWFDRTGKELELGETGAYCDVRLSPDGRKLAFNVGDPYSEIWVKGLARGVGMRLTIDPDTDHGVPVWSPDGSRIGFAALDGKARKGIYQKPSNGAGSEELLLASETSDTPIFPTSWSSDGRFILYVRGDIALSKNDIWVLPLAGDRKPRLFVKTPVAAYDGQFSPDARWVAYTSKESGREEVYVVPFDAAEVLKTGPGAAIPGAGGKWIISTSGGHCPRWRKDGEELFYLSPENKVMAVEIEVRGNGIEPQPPRPLFTAATPGNFFAPYDVTADGSKFVINTPEMQNTPLTLVVNWTARLGIK
jgi:eukaryotic-like serine/threonine-protein kinase